MATTTKIYDDAIEYAKPLPEKGQA
ncbi:hypothetical protein VTL71DRAFT_15925 [Oculimacula yallundae]|uniref:Uncharacterized protein n=1 Tax=Oculimacula yallundae TaxID=86028 RepID=A0ABR4CDS6_9HELO